MDEPLVVYIRDDNEVLKRFDYKPNKAMLEQRSRGEGVDLVSLNWTKYIVLKAVVITANFHLPAYSGMMTIS